MPQIQLPIFPTDCVNITPELAFKKENGTITYFNGSMPVFSHDEHDLQAFRMTSLRKIKVVNVPIRLLLYN